MLHTVSTSPYYDLCFIRKLRVKIYKNISEGFLYKRIARHVDVRAYDKIPNRRRFDEATHQWYIWSSLWPTLYYTIWLLLGARSLKMCLSDVSFACLIFVRFRILCLLLFSVVGLSGLS